MIINLTVTVKQPRRYLGPSSFTVEMAKQARYFEGTDHCTLWAGLDDGNQFPIGEVYQVLPRRLCMPVKSLILQALSGVQGLDLRFAPYQSVQHNGRKVFTFTSHIPEETRHYLLNRVLYGVM